MTRFELLNLLAKQKAPISLKLLAAQSGKWKKKSIDAMRIQLGRAHRWGLVRRRKIRWMARSYRYNISIRGRERLAWARAMRKIQSLP